MNIFLEMFLTLLWPNKVKDDQKKAKQRLDTETILKCVKLNKVKPALGNYNSDSFLSISHKNKTHLFMIFSPIATS